MTDHHRLFLPQVNWSHTDTLSTPKQWNRFIITTSDLDVLFGFGMNGKKTNCSTMEKLICYQFNEHFTL